MLVCKWILTSVGFSVLGKWKARPSKKDAKQMGELFVFLCDTSLIPPHIVSVPCSTAFQQFGEPSGPPIPPGRPCCSDNVSRTVWGSNVDAFRVEAGLPCALKGAKVAG